MATKYQVYQVDVKVAVVAPEGYARRVEKIVHSLVQSPDIGIIGDQSELKRDGSELAEIVGASAEGVRVVDDNPSEKKLQELVINPEEFGLPPGEKVFEAPEEDEFDPYDPEFEDDDEEIEDPDLEDDDDDYDPRG